MIFPSHFCHVPSRLVTEEVGASVTQRRFVCSPMAVPQTRRDGRDYDDLRPVTIKYEGLDRVDGSARFAFGEYHAS